MIINGIPQVPMSVILTQPNYVAGMYYNNHPYMNASVATSTPCTNGTLFYSPIFIGAPMIINTLSMNVRSGATANIRFGIYDSVNGIPTNLLADSGNQSASVAQYIEVTINLRIYKVGWYWGASSASTASVSITGATPTFGLASVLMTNIKTGSLPAGFVYSSWTYAALPSTAPFNNTWAYSQHATFWIKPG